MNNPNLDPKTSQTNNETAPSIEQSKKIGNINGTSVEMAENSNQPDKAQQTRTEGNNLNDHDTEIIGEIAANILGGKFEPVDKDTPIDSSYKFVAKQWLEGNIIEAETNTYLKNQPKGAEQNQNVEQSENQSSSNKTEEQPKPQQPNGQQNSDEVNATDEASETKGASKTSKIGNKKEANNDDDNGVNLAEFFRAKNNIDLHQSKNGRGEKLDDALVQCLSKVPGVKIIKSRFFEKFGEPIAVQYSGVRMSFHGGHVVASGEGKVREIVQSLLEQIKSTVTASDNSEHKDAEANPETGELTIGESKYSFPVPREDIIVLIQNSDGDSAFDHEALKDPNSSTSKAFTQFVNLSKNSILFSQCCPDLNEESITQMKNNSSDTEKSKNNVHPFKQGSFQTVSEQLNVTSSWVDNSMGNTLQQGLGVLYPDLLLNIYDAMYGQYAQEEEATKDQQTQARDINERAKEIAKRTINEYNLLSGQKLEENSEIAAKAFLETLYQEHRNNSQGLSQLNFNSGDSENFQEQVSNHLADTKHLFVEVALEAARQARNAQAPNPNDFSSISSDFEDQNESINNQLNASSTNNPNPINYSAFASSSEIEDPNFDDDPSLEVFNDNKSGQFRSLNRNGTVSESTDKENDSGNFNAKPPAGAAEEGVEQNNSNYYIDLKTNPFN